MYTLICLPLATTSATGGGGGGADSGFTISAYKNNPHYF